MNSCSTFSYPSFVSSDSNNLHVLILIYVFTFLCQHSFTAKLLDVNTALQFYVNPYICLDVKLALRETLSIASMASF